MKRILVFLFIIIAATSWAADRPVKLWGYGNWFQLSPKEWTRSPDMVATFNDWLSKKFGFTVEYAGAVPKGQSWSQALASYIGAKGMPDIIVGADWGAEGTAAFLDFVKNGKLADLTKYYSDKSYPLLSSADKEYLRAYMVNGKIYGIPGGGWHILKDDPYSGGPNWIIRYDLAKKYGTPKTIPELTAFLKAVKADPTAVDLDGKPVAPLMFGTVTDWPGPYAAILEQAFGAGWNITQSGKLMEGWATEEFGKGLTYLNQIYRDGLLDVRTLSNDSNWLDAFLRRGSIAVGSSTSVARYRGETLVAGVKEIADVSDPRAQKLINMQPVMLVPPVADNPGRLVNSIAGVTMISKNAPNIPGIMHFAEFLDTFEGMVMFMAGAGFREQGDWSYVDYPNGPIYWQNNNKEPGNRDLNVVFPWGSVINALGSLSAPTGSSYYETMYYNKYVLKQRLGQFGVKMGQNSIPPDDATALEWSKEYAGAINPLSHPIPSWLQFRYLPTAQEAAAGLTVQQRLNEWMPRVLTAKSQSDFIDLYSQMQDVLVHCAPWKAIYVNKQAAYESWLKANKFDDRKGMPFNTPNRWFLDVMGWIRFPY